MTNSNSSSTVAVKGYEAKEGENMNPNFNGVGPEFFETLGIPAGGRPRVHERRRMDAPKVAVVNETFARYFFGDKDPLGRTLRPRAARKTSDDHDRGRGQGRQGGLASAKSRSASSTCPTRQDTDVGRLTFYVALDGALRKRSGRGCGQVVQRVDSDPARHRAQDA